MEASKYSYSLSALTTKEVFRKQVPLGAQFCLNIFISLLYMFRTSTCPWSGGNYCIYATRRKGSGCSWNRRLDGPHSLIGGFGNTEKSLALFSNHISPTVQSAAYPLHAVLYRGSSIVHVVSVNVHHSLLGFQKYRTFFVM